MNTIIWVNVYLAPYTCNRFYFSQSYPTKQDALNGLKRKNRHMNKRYYDTIKIKL